MSGSAPAGLADDPARALRRSLGCFATGVTIVTAAGRAGEPPIGMTVSSFNSVSLDPPLVLFSIADNARSLEALSEAPAYAVNVLAADHVDLSNRFARPSEAKWDGVDYEPGHLGVPCLPGALAAFECRPYATYDGGDHVIFVGEVVAHRSLPDAQPLVFYRGAYHLVTAHPA
ncbi:MAG TPA: flavin reductase family protein [Ilumatobacter sp.]|nr:flavin reductase family protein [Ilumatobacter sp.]